MSRVTLNQQIVLGAGTGRSGTLSLARLLALQPNTVVSHEFRPIADDGSLGQRVLEPLPWGADIATVEEALFALTLRGPGTVVDVGSYWGPHIRGLVPRLGRRLRVVVIERDRSTVIQSFERKVGDKNHWTNHDGSVWRESPILDRSFPHFDEPDRARAIGLYWDLYHDLVSSLVQDFPEQVKSWDISALSSRSGIHEILSFAGISDDRMWIPSAIWENRSRSTIRSVIYKVRDSIRR